jgi:hypothetical protein
MGDKRVCLPWVSKSLVMPLHKTMEKKKEIKERGLEGLTVMEYEIGICKKTSQK